MGTIALPSVVDYSVAIRRRTSTPFNNRETASVTARGLDVQGHAIYGVYLVLVSRVAYSRTHNEDNLRDHILNFNKIRERWLRYWQERRQVENSVVDRRRE